MNEENKIGYYAVIPATILFNKDLKANEKLLYAIITILSNKEGYCFASNSYLSSLLNAQPHTISKWVSHLKECGWNVINRNGIWKIERTTIYGNEFNFEVDISDTSVSNVVKEIQNYYKSFNKDEYVENMVSIRSSLGLTISEIVSSSENIQEMLNNLSFDVLYKSRLVAQESKNIIEKNAEISNEIINNNSENEKDLDYDYT